jgi:hypothetical protein
MYTSEIIDAHIHIKEGGDWFGKKVDASYDTLVKQMRSAGIKKGLILALAQLNQNDYVKSICEKSNGTFHALAGFNPLAQEIGELDKFLQSDCFKGIKLHPRRDNFSPMDESLFALYEKAERNSWAINFDVFGHTQTLPMDELRPSVFDRIAKKFPELTIVLSHCCAPWVLEAFFVAKSNPNVYLDCSFIISRYDGSSIITDLLYTARHLDRKLIYGSDFPEEPVNRYFSLAKIAFKDLPEEKKANIFCKNAMLAYNIK